MGIASRCRSCIMPALMSCLLTATVVQADDPAAKPALDIRHITEQLVKWKKSFTNLRAVYEVRNPGQWSVRRPDLVGTAALNDCYQRYEWIYTDHGLERIDFEEFEAGVRRVRRVDGNDGRYDFRAEFVGTSTDPTSLDISRLNPSGFSRLHIITPFAMLHLSGKDWIGDWHARQSLRIVGERTVGGTRQIGVKRGPEDQSTAWYDCDHDCLPVADEAPPGVNLPSRWIHEFKQLENGIWMPVRGTTLLSENDTPTEWVVTEIDVNIPLTLDRFACPRAGPHTKVLNRADANLEPLNPASGVHAEAAPQASFSPWLLWSGVAVIVAGGVWLASNRLRYVGVN